MKSFTNGSLRATSKPNPRASLWRQFAGERRATPPQVDEAPSLWLRFQHWRHQIVARLTLQRLRAVAPDDAEAFLPTEFLPQTPPRRARTIPPAVPELTLLMSRPGFRVRFRALAVVETTLKMVKLDPFSYISELTLMKALEQLDEIGAAARTPKLDHLRLQMRIKLSEHGARRQAAAAGESPGFPGFVRPGAEEAPVPVRAPAVAVEPTPARRSPVFDPATLLDDEAYFRRASGDKPDFADTQPMDLGGEPFKK